MADLAVYTQKVFEKLTRSYRYYFTVMAYNFMAIFDTYLINSAI